MSVPGTPAGAMVHVGMHKSASAVLLCMDEHPGMEAVAERVGERTGAAVAEPRGARAWGRGVCRVGTPILQFYGKAGSAGAEACHACTGNVSW